MQDYTTSYHKKYTQFCLNCYFSEIGPQSNIVRGPNLKLARHTLDVATNKQTKFKHFSPHVTRTNQSIGHILAQFLKLAQNLFRIIVVIRG